MPSDQPQRTFNERCGLCHQGAAHEICEEYE